MLRFLAIVGLATAAAILYGLVQDQIGIRYCPEYFTVAHPPVFHTENLTLLALLWGLVSSWWVGLLLGFGLALAAAAGQPPYIEPNSLLRPIAFAFAAVGLVTFLVACLVSAAHIDLFSQQTARQPERLTALFFAYDATYIAAGTAGLWLILATAKRRKAMTQPETAQS